MMAKDKIYVLNPGYQLRNDVHRVALFSKGMLDHSGSKDWISFIHPIQAVMLSFFTYHRTLEENIQLLADYFHRDEAYMEKMVSSYITNPTPIYTQWKDQKINFPKNVLIDLDEVNHPYLYQELSSDLFICEKLDLTSRRFYSGPLLLTFMLTNKCLTRCRYCYADTSTVVQQMLPTSRILQLIQEAARLQVQQVNLMGGEIFLHNDWDVILSELVKYNIAPEYISTKIPLTNELLVKLRNTGYRNLVQISLDALDEDVLYNMLNAPRNYVADILKGIQLLDQSGISFQVSSVLTRYNCDHRMFTDLFRFLSTLENLRNWRIVPVNNSLHAKHKNASDLKPDKADVGSLFEYMEEFILPHAHFPILLGKESINKKFYIDKGGSAQFSGATCSALNTHMFILPDGQVTICEQLYWNPRFIIGSVNNKSLTEVWGSPQALYLSELSQKDIQEKSKCKQCSLFEQCFRSKNRCWSDIVKAYGDQCWDFPDPRCYFASEMKTNLGY